MTDLKGVGKSTAESLDESGYSTVKSVATPPELSAAANTGKGKARKLIRRAQEAAEDLGFKTGSDIMERRGKVEHIPTGSESLDEMLGGGVETQCITEFYGEYSTGKTQLSLNAQTLEGENGRTPHVVYINTEHTFRPERIKSMAEAVDMESDRVLENIHVARASTTDRYEEMLRKV